LQTAVTSGVPSVVSGTGFKKAVMRPTQTGCGSGGWLGTRASGASGLKLLRKTFSSTSAWTVGTAAEANALVACWIWPMILRRASTSSP
jgi:hypothetical protein